MTRYCTVCDRATLDGNLWCARTDCPAEAGHGVLNYGDYLGDVKVVRLLRVWRSAALYEGERNEEKVLLKVANEVDGAEDRLRREAAIFSATTPTGHNPWVARKRTVWPEILPPSIGSKRPYGEISFRGETKIYSVFRHAAGKFLSDLMLENPQLWHQQAAWLIITISEAIQPLATQGKCHTHLTPDMILVDTDTEGHLRPLILDLGMAQPAAEINQNALMLEPAYCAPEIADGRAGRSAFSPAVDVYALGLIYYEMLAGKPAYASAARRDEQVRALVVERHAMLSAKRPELEQAGALKVLDKALASNNARYPSPGELAAALVAIYGRAPAEKYPIPRRTLTVAIIAGLIALVIAGFALYVIATIWMGG